MGTSAGFHADLAAWLDLLQQHLDPFVSLQLVFTDRLLIAINTMYLKHILGQTHANSDNLYFGLLSR